MILLQIMSYLCGLGFSASSHTAAKLVASLGTGSY